MSLAETISHFWIANPPSFSSTLFVSAEDQSATEGKISTALEIFDVDGVKVNTVDVEFPANEVGVIELEPFAAGLKMQGGIAHGHVRIRSPRGTRHLLRQSVGSSVSVYHDPAPVKARESAFIPVVLGGRREHMLVLVNASEEEGQIGCRFYYGNRSPEWTLTIPARGSRVLSIESEMLASADDRAWEKGALQAYLRLTGKHDAPISGHIIERVLGETAEEDTFRCLTSW
jgi:hypothetical protein